MPTSKKSRKCSAGAHRQCWNASENSALREKKSAFYKKQYPEKVAAYLEKIKDIPKEKIVYIDETCIETLVYRQYARSPWGQRLNMRISGKRPCRGSVQRQIDCSILLQ